METIENDYSFMADSITPLETIKDGTTMRHRFELFILKLQKRFCDELQKLEDNGASRKTLNLDSIEFESNSKDGQERKEFHTDRWERKDGGGGISCVMQDSIIFEKAGVNVSVVHGLLPKEAVAQMRQRGKSLDSGPLNFFAAGISSVIHPRNPWAPTVHFNFRYFEVENKENNYSDWWFGGGTDLTPYILDVEDCSFFHIILKKACDQHSPDFYPTFKKECDDYFYVKHRDERRGVGGIFFDDVNYPDLEGAFSFIQTCGAATIDAYLPLVLKNHIRDYNEKDREWQLLRRGRYVEFNLIYDRGTKFGLFTPEARYESILMSLPLHAKWLYCHEPEEGSKEAQLLKVLKNPIEWVPKN